MANNMIALQARAPQTDILGGSIARNAQMINMMRQQDLAERQAATAAQQMQIAQAKEAREAALAKPQMAEAQQKASSAQIKAVSDFLDLSIEGMKMARSAEDAIKIGDWLKTQFTDPQLQASVDQTLSSMPQDPGAFEGWRKQTLFQSMDAKDQLEQHIATQNTGRETFQTASPKYAGAPGGNVASEIPGTRVKAAEDITYVRGPNGEIIPMPKTLPGTGGPVGMGGGDTFSRMIGAESGGQHFARDGSPLTSPKGAVGIAQVMPSTAPEAARLAGLPYDEKRYRTDPEYNRAIGEAYFKKQLADFGDERLAAAAYNAGAGAVQRALKQGGPDGWINFVPRETQEYVAKVFGGKSAGGLQMGEPVAGTDVKARQVESKARSAASAAGTRYDRMIKSAEQLLKSPNLDTIVGNIQGNIPETALGVTSQGAANALALYNTLLVRGGFAELQNLRDASLTGGALGQISDRENVMLQQAAATLARTQDEATFRQNLRDYINELRASKQRVEQAWERDFGKPFSAGSSAPAAARGKTPTSTGTNIDALLKKYGG